MNKCTIEELERHARDIRVDIVESVYRARSGHPGGSLSIAEILSVLFFDEMNIDPANPGWEKRDRFVLSKGHAAPAYYAALAERGYFPVEYLKTLRKIDSKLQGHPDMRKVPGVDMSTGSLGQGIAAASGMALYAKKESRDYRVYCIVGDGESQEGELWEAMMSAAHFGLDNLTVFLDSNDLQIDGNVQSVMGIDPIDKKAEAFGWNVLRVNGHSVSEISDAIQKAKACTGKPTYIICRTVKGKGVSFMENQAGWHGSAPNQEQYERAMLELTGGVC